MAFGKRPLAPTASAATGVKKPAVRPPSRQAAGPPPARPGATSTAVPARERPRPASTSATSLGDDAKDSLIQVVVRCRGRSSQEIKEDSPSIVTVSPTRGTEVTLTTTPQAPVLPPVPTLGPSLSPAQPATLTKTYPFDHVFGPECDQGLIYNEVVAPIVDEVLMGYNCTVFAYGQTGTGKTYTMEGDLVPSLGTYSPGAGIIPRTLHRLFHLLDTEHSDYAVRCSFVELYNEELRDLNAAEISAPSSQAQQPMARAGPVSRQAFVGRASIAPSKAAGAGAGQSQQPELKIYDDNARRGVVIQGLEETLITSAAEGIRVLTRGSQRRQIAATQCNDQSSRSHSIFTITVHMKETASVGAGSGTKGGSEDLLKVGKLNLVDLAGSENVGRSGAEKGRAREAGMINQSLLTLGRVINALVERNAHVPYRESKLTRLLQDSLGGRTKTCIIATISPAKVNLEETLSTLDYALRAKTIQNRPEINQRMTKSALLSQYSIEIERLKADLLAARERNGIYLSPDSWSDMASTHEARRLALEEAQRTSDLYDMQLRTTREQFEHSLRLIGTREAELETIMTALDQVNADLAHRTAELDVTKREAGDEVVLRKAHDAGRQEWRGWARKAIDDTEGLRAKLARKQAVEKANLGVAADAEATFGSATTSLRSQLTAFEQQHHSCAASLRSALVDAAARAVESAEVERRRLAKGKARLDEAHGELDAQIDAFGQGATIYAEAVDGSRDAFVGDARERATDFRAACTAAVDILLVDWSGVLTQSLSAVNELAALVEATHVDAIDALTQNVALLEARAEADRAQLQSENDRLRTQNDALTALLAHQQAAATDFEQSFIASITSQLRQHQQAQAAASRSAVDAVRAAAEGAQELAHIEKSKRKAEDEQLAQRDRSMLQSLQAQQTQLVEAQAHHERRLRADVQAGEEHVQSLATTVEEHISAHEGALDIYEEHAESEATTFAAAAAARRQAVETSAATLVDGVDVSLHASHAGWATMASNVQSKSALLVEEIDALTDSSHRFTSETSSSLSSLQAPILSADMPTGATPKKRVWPDVHSPDDLDALARDALLVQLRGPEPLPTAPTTNVLASTAYALNVSVPAPTKLEIPLGMATGKAGAAVRRSVLGEKSNMGVAAPLIARPRAV